MSPCVDYGDGLTVCFRDSVVLHVEFEERARWCFGCRRHVRYNLRLTGSREPSWYESTWSGRCPNGCGDAASGGFWYVRLLCAAARQPDRGRFRDLALFQRAVGKARSARYLARCDVVGLADGRYYVEGWDEWQEGDWTVAERMRRMRHRRESKRNGDVTVPPSPDRHTDTLAPTLSVTTDAVSSTTPVKGISHGDGDGVAPIPPPSGGRRANGTNPRAVAAEVTRRANAAEADRKARRKARNLASLDGRITEAQRAEMDERDAPLEEIPTKRGAAYQGAST